MSTDTPAILVSFFTQPVVSQELDVEVLRLEGRVMDVRGRALEEKEAVVVDGSLSAA